VILGITWLAGTVYGFSLMRRARIDTYTARPAGKLLSESSAATPEDGAL